MKFFSLAFSLALVSSASAEVLNANELKAALGVQQLSQSPAVRTIRVAVLDNGFEGYQPGSRDVLPKTQLLLGPVQSGQTSPHGFGMAQIVSAVVGLSRQDVELDLIDTNGFSNLKAAVDKVIERKVDVVLYSQNWEFGGNFDGTGFINAQANRALDAGIIWVNAAGNHHGLIYEGRVQDGLRLQLDSFIDANDVSITLAWNDFTDSENYKTLKDLDLEITGPTGEKIAFENRKQDGRDPTEAEPLLSAHARENARVVLSRGRHQLRVVNQSRNFTANDRLRVVITPRDPQSVRLVGATRAAEILTPADNARILTVGDCGNLSSVGPTRDGRSKPDTSLGDARVFFSNGQPSAGTSNAAALVAGVVTLLKARDPNLEAAKLLQWTRELRTRGLSGTCEGAPRWRTPSLVELQRL